MSSPYTILVLHWDLGRLMVWNLGLRFEERVLGLSCGAYGLGCQGLSPRAWGSEFKAESGF